MKTYSILSNSCRGLVALLACTLALNVSTLTRGDDTNNTHSQGSDTKATDRSASNKSGSGNSTVPNGQSTQGGHNPETGSNAGGATAGSQYSTNGSSSSH